MERRKEQRIKLDQPLQVTVLGEQHQVMIGSIVEVSPSGLQLLLPLPVSLDMPVRVDTTDMLLLGEVRYCRAAASGYFAGLEIMHSLSDLDRLHRQRNALLGMEQPARVEAPAVVEDGVRNQ